MKRNVAIVHYNTPMLTKAAILSLRKNGGGDYNVYVFDNSDKNPFTTKMTGMTIFDNTKGNIINFDEELAKYDKNEKIGCASGCEWGSVKHMMSVQALFELIPDGFLLMDSDILIKADVSMMFMEDECCCGYIQQWQKSYNRFRIDRLAPMLLYINVPMCNKGGARFFDAERSWGLFPDENDRRNWYDTGASFLEDIKVKKPLCHGRVLNRSIYVSLFEHYGSGSWRWNDEAKQKEWLDKHADLWKQTPRERGVKDVAICAIGRNENLYAEEWVKHYLSLGVKKIFVYDNPLQESDERLADVLQAFSKKGVVEIIPCVGKENYQCAAYEDCYRRHGDDFAWIGFIDFDEFLRWNGRKKITTMFSQYDADVVMINWRIMTDNGLLHYDSRPLAERFTQPMERERGVKYEWAENKHVKSFVRGGLKDVKFKSPHFPTSPTLRCVNPSGKAVRQTPFMDIDWEVMRIDHYWTKTAEEWRNVKLGRGFSAPDSYTKRILTEQERLFFAVNERTKEKEKIIRG